MADCDDRQLSEAQRQANYQQGRTGVVRAVRPFSGRPTLDNLIDYVNRELYPAVRSTRDKVNDVYLPTVDNAPSANPLIYYFSTDTTAADPTAGRIRVNASPQATATVVRVSETNARLVDSRPWLEVMAGGATTPLGVVTLSDAINPGRFIRFDLTSMTDQGSYWDLGVSPVESSHDDPFVEGGGLVVSFIPGVASTGTTVPASALTPITAQSVLGNPTSATAAPVAIALNDLSVLGRAGVLGTNVAGIDVPGTGTFTGESVFLRVASTRLAIQWRPWTLVDMPAMGDLKFVGNVSGATARPAYTDLAQLGQDLFGIGFDAATHNFKLSSILTDHFLGNITGSTATPAGVPLSDIDSTSLVYDGTTHTFQRAALTGDVTSAQDSNTVTVNTSAITNAKLANMLAGTVKGRQIDAGTGAPVDLTGVEQGENLRIDTSALDASTSGTSTPYVVAADTNWIRFTSLTGLYTLNGCDPATSGKLVVWHVDPGTTGSLVLTHNSGAVSTGFRFTCPGSVDVTLTGGQSAITIFTGNRHRVVAISRQGFALTDGDKGDITLSSSTTVWTIDNDVVSNAKLRDSGALSVIGRSANSTGDPADVSATAASGAVLRESGSTLGFGQIATAGITDAAVTLAKMANLTQQTVIGRAVGAGTGVPTALTAAQQGENIRFNTIVTDTASSGAQATYAMADTTTEVLVNTAATVDIQGIAIPGSNGQRVVFHRQIGAAANWTFRHNSGSAGATQQRLVLSGAADQILGDCQSIELEYSNNRWRQIGGSVQELLDGDKGDITVSANGATWTIDNDVVSDAKLRNSAALSVIGRSANSTGDPADIAAANDAEVLRRSGTALGFGTVATAGLTNNAVTDAKIRQSAALTVIGRAANSTGDVADIGAGADGDVLRRSGTALGFGSIATAGIGDNQVSNAKLRDSGALSVIGRSANSSGDPADISAVAASDSVLRESGSTLGFGTIATGGITNNAVTDAKLRQGTALTVIGRSANSTGNVADIAAVAASGSVLRESGSTVGFGQIATAGITDAAVTLAKMANLAQSSIIGRAESAGTGVPQALTSTQVAAIIDGEPFTWLNTHTFQERVQLDHVVRLGATLTNSSTGTIDDLVIGNVSIVRFTGPPGTFTGMVPTVGGQVVVLVNGTASSGGTNVPVFLESASSTAANRFAGTGTSRVIRPGEMALCLYDGTSSRWRMLCRDDVDL